MWLARAIAGSRSLPFGPGPQTWPTRVTFVGIGRGALSQPDFARRLKQGEPLDPKRLCRTFSFCTALMRSKHNDLGQFATGCPPFDKETYGPIWEEARRKNDS